MSASSDGNLYRTIVRWTIEFLSYIINNNNNSYNIIRRDTQQFFYISIGHISIWIIAYYKRIGCLATQMY